MLNILLRNITVLTAPRHKEKAGPEFQGFGPAPVRIEIPSDPIEALGRGN